MQLKRGESFWFLATLLSAHSVQHLAHSRRLFEASDGTLQLLLGPPEPPAQASQPLAAGEVNFSTATSDAGSSASNNLAQPTSTSTSTSISATTAAAPSASSAPTPSPLSPAQALESTSQHDGQAEAAPSTGLDGRSSQAMLAGVKAKPLVVGGGGGGSSSKQQRPTGSKAQHSPSRQKLAEKPVDSRRELMMAEQQIINQHARLHPSVGSHQRLLLSTKKNEQKLVDFLFNSVSSRRSLLTNLKTAGMPSGSNIIKALGGNKMARSKHSSQLISA